MLIGLCGGICAGKNSVAEHLVEHYAFTRVYMMPPSTQLKGDDPIRRSEVSLNKPIFADAPSLLDYVTQRWQQRWVTTDVWNESTLERFLRRPFFLLISVDAPVSLRWKRLKEKCSTKGVTPPILADFVVTNDAHLFDPQKGLATVIDQAEVRLINQASSKAELYRLLEDLDLASEERLRPNWDQYFMQLASLAAQRSNCMKRRVGCVLIREKRVISTGYNGTPRNLTNCNEGGCARCNSGAAAGVGLSTCLCIHAEENALLEAGRERIREGSILYCDTCPCLTCSIKITQVGIAEVVYSQNYGMDEQTAAIFREGGVKLRQFSPPRKGLVKLGNTIGK